jgi:hypothetical protein
LLDNSGVALNSDVSKEHHKLQPNNLSNMAFRLKELLLEHESQRDSVEIVNYASQQ